MSPHSPIALFVYNRPSHTRQTVEALQRNSLAISSDLYVFADGPKSGAVDQDVNAVRKFVRGITGFKSVSIIERKANIGLDPSIIDGVTSLCNQFGCVIVLEDDLTVSPHFLEYMNHALLRYADEEQVMQISGHVFPMDFSIDTDSFFFPATTSWGWAVWQRSWQHFNTLASHYAELKNNSEMLNRFNLGGAYPYGEILDKVVSGKGTHWDILWYLNVFMRDGLILFPHRTLVTNIGFDGSGTNCGKVEPDQTMLTANYRVLSYPDKIERAEFTDRVAVAWGNAAKRGLLFKFKNWVRHLFL